MTYGVSADDLWTFDESAHTIIFNDGSKEITITETGLVIKEMDRHRTYTLEANSPAVCELEDTRVNLSTRLRCIVLFILRDKVRQYPGVFDKWAAALWSQTVWLVKSNAGKCPSRETIFSYRQAALNSRGDSSREFARTRGHLYLCVRCEDIYISNGSSLPTA